eukprot:TRINITY_DN27609_c0_g1_i1.p1 TRINITY_DN27609_c0_g1~~TRINITY_DN27609_c0_g1_i1.p1  ORF type:complete len:273 (+),score=36.34 TRINITY_DN27609_c0_g1_i1:52-819(+)
MVRGRLISGDVVDIPAHPNEAISKVRGRFAEVLEVESYRVRLYVNGCELSDNDTCESSRKECEGLTVIVSCIEPTKWLRELIFAAGHERCAETETNRTGDVRLVPFVEVASTLQRQIRVTDDMLEVSGLWKYGPRSNDDTRFYGMLLDADGSCRIIEGLEEDDNELGGREQAPSCEWRGIWSRNDMFLQVEAVPVFERCDGDERILSADIGAVHACFELQDMLRHPNLKPVSPFTMWRVSCVPKSRSLYRIHSMT